MIAGKWLLNTLNAQKLHDRIPISLLELSSSKFPSGGLLYNRILERHIKKCLFKIYKWTPESLNSLCDLTSAANLANLLTDCGVKTVADLFMYFD